jgi:hypothetical protein
LRHPERILTAAQAALDLDRPVGLLLIAVLHFLPGTEQAYAAVKTLTDALPAGRYLAATHAPQRPAPHPRRAGPHQRQHPWQR